MGFWSELVGGKDILTTNVVTVPILGDKYPNVVKNAVVNTILAGQDTSTAIKNTLLNGFKQKSNSFLNYGKNNFIYGTPSGSTSTINPDINEVKYVLEHSTGEEVILESVAIEKPNPVIQTLLHIQDNFGWVASKEIDITALVVEGVTWELTSAEYINYTSGYTQIISKFRTITGYRYTQDENIRDDIQVPVYYYTEITFIAKEHIFYYIIVAAFVSNPSVYYIIFYNPLDGTIPSLSIPPDTYLNETGLYPIVPVRKDFNNVRRCLEFGETPPVGNDTADDPIPQCDDTLNNPNEIYDSTRQILRKLNLNINDITASIEENEDSDSIKDAFVLFGLEIDNQTDAGIEYLIRFFLYLYDHSQYSYEDYINWEAPTYEDDYGATVSIPLVEAPKNKYSINEQIYNIVLEYNAIGLIPVTGNIGEVGTLASQITGTNLILSYQTTDTIYYELRVINLVHSTFINDSWGHESFIKQSLRLSDSQQDYKSFIIPISKLRINEMKTKQANEVLYLSLKLVLYAENETHLKWYQTEAFQLIIIVIAVVLAYFTTGQSLHLIETAVIGTGLIASEFVVIVTLAVAVAITIGVPIILEKLIKQFSDNEVVLAIITAAYVAFSAYTGDFSNLLATAEQLLQAVSAVSQVAKIYTKLGAEEIMDKVDDLLASIDSKQEILDNADDLLHGNDVQLDALYIQAQNYLLVESPPNFYNRTLQVNPGIGVFDSMHGFFNRKLRLPENTTIKLA